MEHELEPGIKDLGDYLAILGRHKGKMVLVFVLVFLISVAVALILPPVYQSEATILIEQQSIPPDLVRSTVTSYADQRIQIISQRVMTSANLRRIIEKFGLYKKELKTKSMSEILDMMRENIKLEMVSADVIDPRSGSAKQATIAFTLSYSSASPKAAQQVANEMVTLYLNENMKRRTEVAAETSSFLTVETEKLSEQIGAYESKLADFKNRHAKNLPELTQFNLQLMNRAEEQVTEFSRQIATLKERQIYLQSELAQINPNSAVYTTGEGIVNSAAAQLKALQAEFPGMSARYADSHPDMVKLRRQIEVLKREVDGNAGSTELDRMRTELARLKQRYSAKHPDVKKLQDTIAKLEKEESPSSGQSGSGSGQASTRPDNPAYIQLLTQLEQTKFELHSLQRAIEHQQAKMVVYEQRLTEAPQIEREYNELIRGYDNAQSKYREIRAKQMEADIAQAMEQSRKGERFSLIEPPTVPGKPAKPNRLAIIFIGFVFSVAGAAGIALLFEMMDHSIRGSKALAAVVGEPPLVVVPFIETEAEQQKRIVNRRRLYALVPAMIVGAILALHFFVMPLDVAWVVLQRRLGIDVGQS